MGLDIGGGGARCLLLEVSSGGVHTAFEPWLVPPAESAGDVDLESMWVALTRAARAASAVAAARAEEVAGVAVTSMRLGAVVLDAADEPLYAGWNRDMRAVEIGFDLAQRHGPEWAKRTGRWPAPTGLPARLRWLAREQPGALERARSTLALNDWVALRMCGERATDPSQAGETMLFDLESGAWSWTWIERLGLPKEIFPTIRAAGTRLGSLGASAAQSLGLAAGTPVGMGGGDTQCGLLGVGAVEHGSLGVIAGTTAPLQLVLADPRLDPELRLWSGAHVVPDLWTLESNAGGTGETLDWAGDAFFCEASAPVAALLEAASHVDPGAGGTWSTLGAHVWDARNLRPGFGSLALSSLGIVRGPQTRDKLARAVVEGLVFAIRANADQLSACAPDVSAQLRLAGGLSRGLHFAQLLADVMNSPVAVARHHESSALGAALCAGVAAGTFTELVQAAEACAGVERRFEPTASAAARYAQLYADWCQLRDSQRDWADRAQELSGAVGA
jgi:autoinducer 2 (AI-2) kinase